MIPHPTPYTLHPNVGGEGMESATQIQKNRTEFESLLSRSYGYAYKLAYRFTGNQTDAEDLTQDAFVRAWESFDRYDRRRSFDVWLQRVLSNLAIDRWRRSSRKVSSLDQPFNMNGAEVRLGSLLAHHGPGPEQETILRDQAAQIHDALDRLPDNYRTVIVLADIEEWSYLEVANKMNCPVGTVRSRVHRGRQLLRRMLNASERAPAEGELCIGSKDMH